jgi:hypothetical protein
MERCPDAAKDTDWDDQQEGDSAKLQRIEQRRRDERRHGASVAVGHAHVADDEMANPVPVLDQDRTIDAEFVIEIGDGLRVGERPQDRATNIARQQLPAGEHQNAQQPERDHGEQQALQEDASKSHDWRSTTRVPLCPTPVAS